MDVLKKWEKETEEIRKKVIRSDTINFDDIRFIGGMDISFVKDSETRAVACLVVCSFPDCKIVYEDFRRVELTQPYIPGFLAFREADHLIDLLETLQRKDPHLTPQVVLIDGNGILHQHRAGLACHIGVRTGICSIGIAKNFLQVENLDYPTVKKDFRTNCSTAKTWIPLVGCNGTLLGAAVATVANLQKPIFVSIGHGLTLELALKIVFAVSHYRQPEPIRFADQRSREFIRLMN